jgi:hypothetical protein
MNHTTIVRFSVAISLVLVLLMISPLSNTRMQAALAQSYNNPPNSNSSAMPIAPPDKVTLSPSTNLPKLSDDRRQLLDQHTDQNHHAPSIPSSGVPPNIW